MTFEKDYKCKNDKTKKYLNLVIAFVEKNNLNINVNSYTYLMLVHIFIVKLKLSFYL